MDVIIPNLVCVLFDPAIPTSSFNLLNYFLYLLLYRMATNFTCEDIIELITDDAWGDSEGE